MTDINDAVQAVEKRHRFRRSDDFKMLMLIVALSAGLVAGGIAWGTATAAVSQKVDKSEFEKHVSAEEKRALVDSLKLEYQAKALDRIESKVDSSNDRLRRLVCDGHPAYCR